MENRWQLLVIGLVRPGSRDSEEWVQGVWELLVK